MSENIKRTIVCCGIGWGLAGSSTTDHALVGVGIVLLIARLVIFTEDGHTRRWTRSASRETHP